MLAGSSDEIGISIRIRSRRIIRALFRRSIRGVIIIIIIGVIVSGSDAMVIGEEKAGSGPLAMSEGVNAVNNILGHREGSPMIAIKAAAGGQTHEVVSALSIAGGAEGDGASSS